VEVGLGVDLEAVEVRSGMVVGPGMIRYGVPLMVVVLPCSPAAALESGIVVAEG